ncbi:MAG: VRR-NUC domain-containing protein [Methylobacter sp.]
MSEHDHQCAYFRWFRVQYPDVLAYAIPNGGHRHAVVGKKLKDEGVTAGIPDIFIADGKPGMFIEMKEPKKGAVSKTQKAIFPRLEKAGYQVAVCYGWDQARESTINYLTTKTEKFNAK